ncbi:DNA mismatch repair endonuclease MutH [Methylophaga sp. OBS3]|uniref:DNA mismatch repair endonuclease MutH n=1 Tax=Methylophaga sp. OBS3 TaxID=2991934 RepID=UPI0022539199|nr:DNA mismatch repair endonuclease MutH [Methylophaga sp. OBS3]MCX4190435.1 DNA mismatch repair endonuclease MutH [Methylophaga sp. OBS3]
MSDEILPSVVPPQSEDELMQRCQQIAGQTLGQLAAQAGIIVPNDLRRHKGWVGNLLENLLGADAGNHAEPDFTGLGIELKTLPLAANGLPKESTYVCTVSMTETGELSWQDSWLCRKLSKVLWLPVEADKQIPLAERYVGQGFIWQPDETQTALLKQDWEELMDALVLHGQAGLTARHGQVLQIRPKAANSRVLAQAIADDGSVELQNPRGFYLRSEFTAQILQADKACRSPA